MTNTHGFGEVQVGVEGGGVNTVNANFQDTWHVALGAQYHLTKRMNIGLAETFMWGGDMAVSQGAPATLRGLVSGSFNDVWFSITTVNMSYKF